MRNSSFQPLKSPSLKELFVGEIENRIISGELAIGERLPPERELAELLHVSRGVVNAGIVELAAKGFLELRPRQGSFVADYNRKGSLPILMAIMNYHGGRLDPQIFESLMAVRQLIEVESAALAATRRTQDELRDMETTLELMKPGSGRSADYLAQENFSLHYAIVRASGNLLYAMILGAFEPLCLKLIQSYLSNEEDRERSYRRHEELVGAIRDGQAELAAERMRGILETGAAFLSSMAV